MKRSASITVLLALVILACAPPPRSTDLPPSSGSPDKSEIIRQRHTEIAQARLATFESAAYLLELRVNDDGRRFTVTTELYFSGDSVGFYGRGYFGRGTFKGNIIGDLATVYFPGEKEFYQEMVGDFNTGADCAEPSEVLIFVLSRLGGSSQPAELIDRVAVAKREFKTEAGRFDRYLKLNKKGIPVRDMLIDPICGDSIVFKYYDQKRKFPFYKMENFLYYNGPANFRARGFVREQKYNIKIRSKKFELEIDPSARRIVSF